MNNPRTPLLEDEYAELDAFLQSDAVTEQAMSLPMLDGFLTALASSPQLNMPSTWLSLIWGDDEEVTPAFSSTEEAEYILGLIMRHMNGIIARFQKTACTPFFLHVPEDDQFLAAQEWSYGYMCGISLDMKTWEPLFADEVRGLCLAPLIIPSGAPELLDVPQDDDMIVMSISLIPTAAVGVYSYWRAQEQDAQQRREPKKIAIKRTSLKKKETKSKSAERTPRS